MTRQHQILVPSN